MEEIWKDVIGFEGIYKASNLGRVKSLKRIEKTRNRWGDCYRERGEKILKPNKRRNGYLVYELNKNGVPKSIGCHRIVWEAFFGKIKKGNVVHHKNKERSDNRIDNLQELDVNEHGKLHRHESWNKGRNWTKEEIEIRQKSRNEFYLPKNIETMKLKKDGLSANEIAQKLGICTRQVYSRLKKCEELGIG